MFNDTPAQNLNRLLGDRQMATYFESNSDPALNSHFDAALCRDMFSFLKHGYGFVISDIYIYSDEKTKPMAD